MGVSTIGLVMVVRDEASVIGPCLDSAKDLIDYWVLCDTGSTDGTQDLVRRTLASVPGELHESPSSDKGQNLTAALGLARGKADYHLLLEADMALNVADEFKGSLAADSHLLREAGESDCWVERLVSDRHQWRCVGAARPFLHSASSATRTKLQHLVISRREIPEQHLADCRRDIELLKESCERGSNVQRATFHLAQCYRDLGNLPLAIEYYEKRATMGGWAEEVWYSHYQVARLQQRLGISWMLVLSQYLRAYQFRPSRIEPLFHVARYYRENGELDLAKLFAKPGLRAEYPDDLLFIEREVYEGGLREECEACCLTKTD